MLWPGDRRNAAAMDRLTRQHQPPRIRSVQFIVSCASTLKEPAIALLVFAFACLAEINLFRGGLMDPFRVCLAMGPLGVYLLAIGLMNLSRRPWVTTGFRDGLALTIGMMGLVIVGPLELLMPGRAGLARLDCLAGLAGAVRRIGAVWRCCSNRRDW